jgi:DNA-binding transcriptional MerR regulator/effector-binding domain-containing protein
MSEEEGLLPIGTLARLSRLSIKALRRYADDGLLVPAWIDPSSGYRYYARAQVRDAAAIALLRSLDVPLSAIRDILAARHGPDLQALLERERARAEREAERRHAAVRSLGRLLAAGDVLPYEVMLADGPARRLVGVSADVPEAELGVGVTALVGELLEIGREAGWPASGPIVGLYPVDPVDPCPVTVAVAEIEGTAARGRARVHALPGGPVLSTVHVGPYDELSLAYTAVLTAAHERGHEPRGPIAETYLTDPAQVAPAEYVTRLEVPISP